MRDERSTIRPVDRASPAATSPTVLTMLKRSVIRAGLYARGTIGEAARAVADACGACPDAGRLSTSEAKKVVYDPTQAAPSFADLPLYRGILKHKEIGRLFDIEDPFYRCHEARHGVTTQIAGQNYVNFASYDYLGLNQHPAVVDAAKKAIEQPRHVGVGEPHRRRREDHARRARDGAGRFLRRRGGDHVRQRPRHQRVDHRHAHDAGRSRSLRRSVAQQPDRRHQAVGRHRLRLQAQRRRRARGTAAEAPPSPQARADRRRGPVLDGWRHRRPAEPRRSSRRSTARG